jgi:hypothetical protein
MNYIPPLYEPRQLSQYNDWIGSRGSISDRDKKDYSLFHSV